MFFAAIGTLTNPQLFLDHWVSVGSLTVGIVLGKAAIVFAVALIFRSPVGVAAATALCLAQIGEFSFVLLDISRTSGLVSPEFFKLMVTVIVGTLFATPYLVALASRASNRLGKVHRRMEVSEGNDDGTARVVLVGFGPAGQSVASQLRNEDTPLVVIEWNSHLASEAETLGFEVVLGDATRTGVLKRAGVMGAVAVGVTVPDPAVAQQITAQVRALAGGLAIVTRSRYQRHSDELQASGATFVSDEEALVGLDIAAELKRALHTTGVETSSG